MSTARWFMVPSDRNRLLRFSIREHITNKGKLYRRSCAKVEDAEQEDLYGAGMVSVVVRVDHGVAPLAVTLSALVPGVAAGLIGDAVVLVTRPDPAVDRVADAVGATLVVASDGSWARGAQGARRDWILCLADGDVPAEGWIRGLEQFIALSPPDRGFGRLSRQQVPLRKRLGLLLKSRQVQAGDVVRRHLLQTGSALGRPVRVAAFIKRDPGLR